MLIGDRGGGLMTCGAIGVNDTPFERELMDFHRGWGKKREGKRFEYFSLAVDTVFLHKVYVLDGLLG